MSLESEETHSSSVSLVRRPSVTEKSLYQFYFPICVSCFEYFLNRYFQSFSLKIDLSFLPVRSIVPSYPLILKLADPVDIGIIIYLSIPLHSIKSYFYYLPTRTLPRCSCGCPASHCYLRNLHEMFVQLHNIYHRREADLNMLCDMFRQDLHKHVFRINGTFIYYSTHFCAFVTSNTSPKHEFYSFDRYCDYSLISIRHQSSSYAQSLDSSTLNLVIIYHFDVSSFVPVIHDQPSRELVRTLDVCQGDDYSGFDQIVPKHTYNLFTESIVQYLQDQSRQTPLFYPFNHFSTLIIEVADLHKIKIPCKYSPFATILPFVDKSLLFKLKNSINSRVTEYISPKMVQVNKRFYPESMKVVFTHGYSLLMFDSEFSFSEWFSSDVPKIHPSNPTTKYFIYSYGRPQDFHLILPLIFPFLKFIKSNQTYCSRAHQYILMGYLNAVMRFEMPYLTPDQLLHSKTMKWNLFDTLKFCQALYLIKLMKVFACDPVTFRFLFCLHNESKLLSSFANDNLRVQLNGLHYDMTHLRHSLINEFRLMKKVVLRKKHFKVQYRCLAQALRGLHDPDVGDSCVLGYDFDIPSLFQDALDALIRFISPLKDAIASFTSVFGNLFSTALSSCYHMLPTCIQGLLKSFKDCLTSLTQSAFLLKFLLVCLIILAIFGTIKMVSSISWEFEFINWIMGYDKSEALVVPTVHGESTIAVSLPWIGTCLTGLNLETTQSFFKNAIGYRSLKVLFEDVVEGSQELFYMLYYKVTGEPWCISQAWKNRYQAVSDEVHEVLIFAGASKDYDYSKRITTDQVWCDKVLVVLDKYFKVYDDRPSHLFDENILRVHRALRESYIKLYARIVGECPKSRSRISPLNILFFSARSRSGKDTSALAFVRVIYQILHERYPDRYPHPWCDTLIHSQALGTDYWEGYKPGITQAVHYSEYLNTADTTKAALQSSTLLDLLDDRPMPLNMANVDLKGAMFAIHTINVVTSPHTPTQINQHSQLRQAHCVQKRFDIALEPDLSNHRSADWDFDPEHIQYTVHCYITDAEDDNSAFRMVKEFRHLNGKKASFMEIVLLLVAQAEKLATRESVYDRGMRTLAKWKEQNHKGDSVIFESLYRNVKEVIVSAPKIVRSYTSRFWGNFSFEAYLDSSFFPNSLYSKDMYYLDTLHPGITDENLRLSPEASYTMFSTFCLWIWPTTSNELNGLQKFERALYAFLICIRFFTVQQTSVFGATYIFTADALQAMCACESSLREKLKATHLCLDWSKAPDPKARFIHDMLHLRNKCVYDGFAHLSYRDFFHYFMMWAESCLNNPQDLIDFSDDLQTDFAFKRQTELNEIPPYYYYYFGDQPREIDDFSGWYFDRESGTDDFYPDVIGSTILASEFYRKYGESAYARLPDQYYSEEPFGHLDSHKKSRWWEKKAQISPMLGSGVLIIDMINFLNVQHDNCVMIRSEYEIRRDQYKTYRLKGYLDSFWDFLCDWKKEIALFMSSIAVIAGAIGIYYSSKIEPVKKGTSDGRQQIVLSQSQRKETMALAPHLRADHMRSAYGIKVEGSYNIVSDDIAGKNLLTQTVEVPIRQTTSTSAQKKSKNLSVDPNRTTTTTTQLSVEPDRTTSTSRTLSADPSRISSTSQHLSIDPQRTISTSHNLMLPASELLAFFPLATPIKNDPLDPFHSAYASGYRFVYTLTGEDVIDIDQWQDSEVLSKMHFFSSHGCLLIGEIAERFKSIFSKSLENCKTLGYSTTGQEVSEFNTRAAQIADNLVQITVSNSRNSLPGTVLFIASRTCCFPKHYLSVCPEWTDIAFHLHESAEPYHFARHELQFDLFDNRDMLKCTILSRKFSEFKSILHRLPADPYVVARSDKVCRIFRKPNLEKKTVSYIFTIHETPCIQVMQRQFVGHARQWDDGTTVLTPFNLYYVLENAPTVWGDCGTPCVNMDVHSHQRDLFGMVVAKNGSSCVICPLAQSDFPELKTSKNVIVPTEITWKMTDDFVSHGESMIYNYPLVPGCRMTHMITPTPVFPANNTAFTKSPIFDDVDVFVSKYRNAEFSMPRIPVKPTNLSREAADNAFARLSLVSGAPPIPANILRYLENPIIFKGFGGTNSGTSYSIRSLYHTLFDWRGLVGFPTDKSATFDLRLFGKQRKDMWGQDGCPNPNWLCPEDPEQKRWINPFFRRQVDQLIQKLDSGTCDVQGMSEMALKDELTSLEKSDNKKTRLFCVSSLLLAVVCKMLLGDFMGNHANKIFNPVKIGVNAYSQDWEHIRNALLQFANLIGGDYGGWDYSVLVLFVPLFAKWMKSLPWEGDIIRIHKWIDALAPSVCSFFLIYGRNIVQRFQGVSSGHYWTSLFNSFVNYCLFGVAFYALVPEIFWPERDSLYRALFYGDDNGGCVSDLIKEYYNLMTISSFFKQTFGMTLTTPTKGEFTSPFLNMDEFTFLSRKFVDRDGIVDAPLDPVAIVGMLAWVRKPKAGVDMTISEQLDQNIETALRELIMYDREDYDEWCSFFESVRGKYGGKFAVLDYPVARQIRLFNYYQ